MLYQNKVIRGDSLSKREEPILPTKLIHHQRAKSSEKILIVTPNKEKHLIPYAIISHTSSSVLNSEGKATLFVIR